MKSRFIIQAILAIALSLFTVGCGIEETSETSQNNVSTGTFIDAPVKGLRYVTATQSGYTDEDGKFLYEDGQDIEFFLGTLSLGKVKAIIVMTPYTLGGGSIGFETNKSANIAVLLQSCNSGSDNKMDVAKYKKFNFGNALKLSYGEQDFRNNLPNDLKEVGRKDALHKMDTYLKTFTNYKDPIPSKNEEGSENSNEASDEEPKPDVKPTSKPTPTAPKPDVKHTPKPKPTPKPAVPKPDVKPTPKPAPTTPKPDVKPANSTIASISSAQKAEFLNAINNARGQQQDCGVYGVKSATHALKWNDKLYKAAYIYNYDMDNGDAWHHVGSNTAYDIVAKKDLLGHGSKLSDRVKHYAYQYSTVGENIAKGQSSVSAVIAAWIDSDGHCKNLMSPSFTEVGMSLLVGTGTATKTTYSNGKQTTQEVEIPFNYWTQDFGTPRGSSAPVTPAPTPTGNEDYTIYVYGHDNCGRTTRMRRNLTNDGISFVYKNLYNSDKTRNTEVSNEFYAIVNNNNLSVDNSVALPVVKVDATTDSYFANPNYTSDIKPLIGL